MEVGTLWTQKGIPWKFKRIVFICRMQNAVLSGVESFCLSDNDYMDIDKAISAVGRLALMGKACEWEGDQITKKMTNDEVLHAWQVSTSRTSAKWHLSFGSVEKTAERITKESEEEKCLHLEDFAQKPEAWVPLWPAPAALPLGRG